MNPGCKKKVQKRDKMRRKKKRMLKEIRGVRMRYMCKKMKKMPATSQGRRHSYYLTYQIQYFQCFVDLIQNCINSSIEVHIILFSTLTNLITFLSKHFQLSKQKLCENLKKKCFY